MAVSGIREVPYTPNSPDAITGELTGASGGVFIELWDENGVAASPQSSGCNRMGDTDFYAWPVSGLTSVPDVRSFFHWRMTAASGSSNAPEGDVVLFTVEGKDGQMPSLNDQSSYIVQN
jgi:hypothetical protein